MPTITLHEPPVIPLYSLSTVFFFITSLNVNVTAAREWSDFNMYLNDKIQERFVSFQSTSNPGSGKSPKKTVMLV